MSTQETSDAPARDLHPATVSVGLLILRLLVGVGIAAHGAQKLFGLFNGGGIEANAEFFESVGYSPGTPYAVLSGLVEFGGGLLLSLGVAVPLAAAAVVANMVGAYSVVQAATPGDFFASTGGPELELFYILTAFALIFTGAGRLAIRIPALAGPKLRMLGVIPAVVGGVGALLVRNL